MKALFNFAILIMLLAQASYASDQLKSNTLIQAVLENNPQKILTLLKAGENINQLTGNGESVLCAASMMGKFDAAKALIDNGANLQDSCLILAVANGNSNIVELFLHKGKSADTLANKNGDTLLHLAVRANYIDVAGILLQSGAKKDIKNKDNLTPSDLIKQAREKLDKLDALLAH